MTTTISIPTLVQKRSLIYRGFTITPSSTLYTPSASIKVGSGSAAAQQTDTNLSTAIPISNGTVCDSGANTLTGSAGGSNSTNNTTTYKIGAGVSDNTAQNLITTGSNVTKQWTKTGIAVSVVTTKYVGQWIYIKDATALAKFKSSSTALEFRYGSDASNYYSLAFTAAQLTTGWNWLPATGLVSALTPTGSPGTLSRFDIIITTNNATDAFVAGDVVYDLLRQWQASDLTLAFDTGYPTVDLTKIQSEWRVTLLSPLAVGYNIDAAYVFNADTTISANEAHTFTSESKSDTDEFVFVGRGNLL